MSDSDGTGAGIDDAGISPQGDAFDFGAMAWVNNTQVGGLMTANAPNVTYAPSVIAGLNVNYSYFLAADSATVRALLTLNNPTASDITVPVDYGSNFGSDGNTAVQASSSGDTTFTAADRWVVTDDSDLAGADVANTTVLFGPNSPDVTPASVSQTVFSSSGTQGVLAAYNITIPAGQTRSLMFFQKMNTTSALATSEAPTFFDGNPTADLVSGLTNFQSARIANWDLGFPLDVPVADSGSLYAVNEAGSVVLSAANSTYTAGTITAYDWDLDNNGSFETTGVSPTFDAAGIDGPTTQTVGLRITSSDGEFAFDTATIHINDVASSVLLSLSSGVIQENGSTTLTGTITDPSTAEVFNLVLNWGDPLSPNNAQTFTLGAATLTVAVDGINWNPVTRVFSLPHQYLDDNPSATPNDIYSITAAVSDASSLPRVLFVSDSDTDLTIPAALGNGFDITVVTDDFANGNAALLADLSKFAAVVWSSTGSGVGGVAPAAVITNLTTYVTGGGKLFVTGYDSVASPNDPDLIQFLGATNSADISDLPTAVANLATSLTTGVVDIRNVVPTNAYSDLDALAGLAPDTVGIVSSTGGFQWTLRTIGDGEIAYVSNGAFTGDSFDNWLVTAPLGEATYNAAVRNFAAAAATNNPPALATTETLFVQVNNVAPVAVPKFASTNENSTIVPFNVLSGFTDVGTLDTHTVVPINGTSPLGGSYFFTAVGLFAYSPNGQFEALPLGSSAVDTISYTIVDDDGGMSTSTAAVTINGLNDEPVLDINLGLTVLEGAAATVIDNTRLQASDVDTGTQLVYTVTAVPANGTLALSGTPLVAGGTFTPADIDAGLLTYANNGNDSNSDSFTFTVSDGAGGSIPATPFDIAVTPVNDAPTLNPIANLPTLPNSPGLQTVNLTGISAGGTEVQTLTVTATSSNPALIPNPTVTHISPASTGSLSFTPVANQSGTVTITVTVTDDGGLANGGVNTVTQTFTVTVAPPLNVPGLVGVFADPENPGQNVLVANGTNGLDLIVVTEIGTRTLVSIPLSGVFRYFDNSSFQRILINGLDGHDRIILGPTIAKNATINGDAGNDIIVSGAGHDLIRAGAGIDVVYGRAGSDFIYGDAAADYLYGEAGNDVLIGGQGDDWLSGGADRDILNGGEGLDTILGDGGDDLIISGNFSHANNRTELLAIQAIWTSNQSFTARINGLASKVNSTTVTSDGKFDWIFTGQGRDWAVDYALMDLLFDFNYSTTSGDKRN